MSFAAWLKERGKDGGTTPGFNPLEDSIGRWCWCASSGWTEDTIEAALKEYLELKAVACGEHTITDAEYVMLEVAKATVGCK